MGLIDRLTAPRARADVTWEPTDDRWYEPIGSWASTFAGFGLSPSTATRVSAVFACTSIIAETLASMPCTLYRRLAKDAREKARDHRLYGTLRSVANRVTQIGAREFFAGGQFALGLHSQAFAEIQDDGRVVNLAPWHPDRVRVETLDGGRRRYRVHDDRGRERVLRQEEMLHVRDLSFDGYTVQARAALAREAISVARAIEAFKGAFFKNDATGRMVLTIPGQMPGPDKRKEFRQFVTEHYAGAANRGRPLLLWNGATAQEVGGEHERGFMIDPANFQIADIARYWHVPSFLLGIPGPTAWGGGLEEQVQAFVDFGVAPWADRWVEALTLALLDEAEQEQYFIEFNFNARVRANLLQRYQAYQIAKSIGMYNANELRRKENDNPREDPGGDQYQDNSPGAAPSQPRESAMPARPAADMEDMEDEDMEAVAMGPLVHDAVARIAAAETREVEKRAAKAGEDPGKWATWLAKFTGEQREYAVKVVSPLVEAQGLPAWVGPTVGSRVEQTALLALKDGVPEGWLAGRAAELATIITETLQAGAAVKAQAA